MTQQFIKLGFLGGLGMTEILIILGVVVLMFGGRKIPELMKGIGQGLKSMRDASKEVEETKDELKK
jgi:sec-independent protein translocase protein TatA